MTPLGPTMQCPLVYIGSLVVNVAAAVQFEVPALTCGRAITHAADTESRRCEQPKDCAIQGGRGGSLRTAASQETKKSSKPAKP